MVIYISHISLRPAYHLQSTLTLQKLVTKYNAGGPALLQESSGSKANGKSPQTVTTVHDHTLPGTGALYSAARSPLGDFNSNASGIASPIDHSGCNPRHAMEPPAMGDAKNLAKGADSGAATGPNTQSSRQHRVHGPSRGEPSRDRVADPEAERNTLIKPLRKKTRRGLKGKARRDRDDKAAKLKMEAEVLKKDVQPLKRPSIDSEGNPGQVKRIRTNKAISTNAILDTNSTLAPIELPIRVKTLPWIP
ncbi:MAG: hypothetical protein Q9221_000690 [Calogaya cf. arnoldii]